MIDKQELLYAQSGAVLYVPAEDDWRYVLITSNSGNWIFPKGLIEFGMTGCETALMEAEEEAGVQGEIDSTVLGSYTYEKWGGVCHVDMHLMRVNQISDDWLESDLRTRIIIAYDQALAIINKKQAPILELAQQTIANLYVRDKKS